VNNAADELDRVADLCARLDLAVRESDLASAVLEPIAAAVGAETASLRWFGVADGVPKLVSVVDLAVPASVREAYLARYFELDPVLGLMARRLAQPLFADPKRRGQWSSEDGAPAEPAVYGENFRRYRNEFLLPNHFYHHVGFCVQSADGRTVALDFHRGSRSSPFGPLERARARLVAAYLHARIGAKWPHGASSTAQPDVALTNREAQVAEAVAIGLTNKQVAEKLGISVRTVENHLRSIFAKCNVATRTRLAAKLRSLEEAFRCVAR
jgi:DNA-binding CsgD family transcriptional regulator